MTLANSLGYLLERDSSARWRIIAIAIVAMSLSGFLLDVFGVSLVFCERWASLVGLAVLFGQSALYVAGNRIDSDSRQAKPSRQPAFVEPLGQTAKAASPGGTPRVL